MAQTQTDFLEASVSLRLLLESLQADMSSLSASSNEALQGLARRFSKSWEQWPELWQQYKRSVHAMPRELRQRRLVKGLLKDMEAFERDVRQFIDELREKSWADVYRTVLQSRINQVTEQVAALEQNPLVQKCLRGEVILSSKQSIQWTRKWTHALLGCAFLYLFAFSGLSEALVWTIAAPFLLFAFSLETARHYNPRVNAWVWQAFKPIMREREKVQINSAMFYICAMAVVYFVFPIEVTIVTMLFIAIGDPMAGIVGVTWGRHRLSAHVSLEGSMACAATCALIAGLCAAVVFETPLAGFALLGFAVLSGLCGALAEASFKKIDDNLVMPLLSAPVLWGLMHLFGIL